MHAQHWGWLGLLMLQRWLKKQLFCASLAFPHDNFLCWLDLVIWNGDRPMDVKLVDAFSKDISSVFTSKSLCSTSVPDSAGLLAASEWHHGHNFIPGFIDASFCKRSASLVETKTSKQKNLDWRDHNIFCYSSKLVEINQSVMNASIMSISPRKPILFVMSSTLFVVKVLKLVVPTLQVWVNLAVQNLRVYKQSKAKCQNGYCTRQDDNLRQLGPVLFHKLL